MNALGSEWGYSCVIIKHAIPRRCQSVWNGGSRILALVINNKLCLIYVYATASPEIEAYD